MAALRDIARDFATEIRDGIGWTIVYRTGRSWNALTIWSDIWNGEWETDDLNDAIGILKADPDAVIVNGYFFSYFPELKPSPKGDTTHGPKTEQPRKQVEGQVRQPVRQPDRLDRGR